MRHHIGDLIIKVERFRRLCGQQGSKHRQGIVAFEGPCSQKHLIKNDPNGKQVGLGADFKSPGLLGSHISGGSHDGPGLRDPGILGPSSGQPKIQNPNSAPWPFQPNISRFNVSMNQPLGVGSGKPCQRFSNDSKRFPKLRLAIPVEFFVERLPLKKRHG